MDLGLAGKKAIIAGASRGIGKAIAIEMARESIDCAIVARDMTALAETAADIKRETNGNVIPFSCDVTERGAVDKMVSDVHDALGGLDILVNSASLPGGSPNAIGAIETVDDEALLSDFNVKYVGALRCARAALPYMQKNGWGRIINISGSNARTPGNLSGGARNVSLVHFTRTLALQFGRDGITVNCIHPGMTRTERTPSIFAARAEKEGIMPEEAERLAFVPGGLNENALGRMVDAQEVAYAAVFLASEQARAITGELIAANGGQGNAVWY